MDESRDLKSLRKHAVETIHALEAGEQRHLLVAPQFAIHLCDRIEALEAEIAANRLGLTFGDV